LPNSSAFRARLMRKKECQKENNEVFKKGGKKIAYGGLHSTNLGDIAKKRRMRKI